MTKRRPVSAASILAVTATITFGAGFLPSAVATDPADCADNVLACGEIPEDADAIFDALDQLVAGAKCVRRDSSTYTRNVWSNGFSDSGVGDFRSAPANIWGLAMPLNFDGSGGHIGNVYKCHKDGTLCDLGGYAGETGDFSWAGTTADGYGGSLAVSSTYRYPAHLYKCDNSDSQDVARTAARSDAGLIDGTFGASATHGGLLVGSSVGRVGLFAESTKQFGFETYSYNWQYEGTGCVFVIGVCAVQVPVEGEGADKDHIT